jgi:hypothetical protein
MDYYLKYIKYKNKYLLLRGGKIPEIDDEISTKKYLPLNYSDYTLTLNNKVIKEGNDTTYNLNSEFKYEQVNKEDIIPTIVKDYYLFYNEKILINNIEIPFETLFIDNSFDIIYGLYDLLTCDLTLPIFQKIIKDEDRQIIESIDAIIKDNEMLYKQYAYGKKVDYHELKKQIKDDINFLNEHKLEVSSSEYSKKISDLKLQKYKLTISIDILQDEINYLIDMLRRVDGSNMERINLITLIKNNTDKKDKQIIKDIKFLDEQNDDRKKIIEIIKDVDNKILNNINNIKKINSENNKYFEIDKKLSNIFKFKFTVNGRIYDKYKYYDNYKKYDNYKQYNIFNDKVEFKDNHYEGIFKEDENFKTVNNYQSAYNNALEKKEKYNNAINDMINYCNEEINKTHDDKTYDDKIYNKIVKNEVNNKYNSIEKIYTNYFKLNLDEFICIGISIKPNILNKYIFINKFRELLEILYSDSNTDDEIKTQILKLYNNNEDAFINISDMMKLYDNTISSINKIEDGKIQDYSNNINNKTKSKVFNEYIKNEIKLIMELKEFIKYCDIIDNTDGLKDFFKIKTSIIFFASFIGAHFKKLIFPKLDNFLFPTNFDNIICNLLNISNDELLKKYNDLFLEYKQINEQLKNENDNIENTIKKIMKTHNIKKNENEFNNIFNQLKNLNEMKRNKQIETSMKNYDLYNINNLPKVFKYGRAIYGNNKFPDCVENTLLHFVRAIIWDPNTQDYNTDFLPNTSIQELKDFVKSLNIGNENTQEIKNEFNKIIQNKKQFKDLYNSNNGDIKYEIISSIKIFKTFINYLFGIPDYKYPNINIEKIKEDNDVIYIKYKNISNILKFTIYDGHSKVNINITNMKRLSKYRYIDLIYLLSSDFEDYVIPEFNKYIKEYKNDKKDIPFYLTYYINRTYFR